MTVLLLLLFAFVVWEAFSTRQVLKAYQAELRQLLATEPAQRAVQQSHDTLVLNLLDKHGKLQHEMNIHAAEAPETVTYAGVTYQRRHKLRSGPHVYRAI